MPKFQCSGCSYESTEKTKVKRHIANKMKCSEEELSIIELECSFTCEKCMTEFSTNLIKTRHSKTCKGKAVSLIEQLTDEIKIIKKQNEDINNFWREEFQKVSLMCQMFEKEKKKHPQVDYTLLPNNYVFKNGSDGLCEYWETKSFVPSNYELVRQTMCDYNNDDDNIQVSIKGSRSILLDANIDNTDYIELEDGTQFFYDKIKGEKRASDYLKIYPTVHCSNKANLKYKDDVYCTECYEKVKKNHEHSDNTDSGIDSDGVDSDSDI